MRQSLLSRCHIFTLEPLNQSAILKIIGRGIKHLRQYGLKIDKEAIKYISIVANKDARRALSILEAAYNYDLSISLDVVKKIAPSKYHKCDDDNIYNLVSWLQGAVQHSDPNAAIYALAAALEAGVDPRYLARRILVSAAEDAFSNPICTAVAHAAYTAACEIGRPECDIILAQATILVAQSPRNKTACVAIHEAVKDVRDRVSIEVPKSMRDCHYPGCEKLGNGAYKDGANQDAYVGISKKYCHPEDWERNKEK